jgi:hypothetical protein
MTAKPRWSAGLRTIEIVVARIWGGPLERYLRYVESRPVAVGNPEFDLASPAGQQTYRNALRSVANVLAARHARHLLGWGSSINCLPSPTLCLVVACLSAAR